MKLLSLVGPSAMVASLAYVYNARRTSGFPVSTSVYVFLLFVVYATGVIPRCPLFPDRFFKPNIFPLLYNMYCSRAIGYRFLKPVMHAPAQYPHSDYRAGIRLLSGSRGKFTFVSTSPNSYAARSAAAAARAGYYDSGSEFKKRPVNGGRGSDYVNLSTITTQPVKTGTLVIPVPMFTDNYSYLIVSLDTHRVVVVDPADPRAVLQLLRSVERVVGEPLQLTEILTTHKHWDHAGGNQELLDLARNHAASATRPVVTEERDAPQASAPVNSNEALAYLVDPNLEIIGSQLDAPMACTRLVQPSDVLLLAGKGVSVKVLSAPGHTRGSVMYLVGDVPPADGARASTPDVPVCTALFTGDALFSGGFGAPFETSSLEAVAQTRRSFLTDPAITTQPCTGETIADENVLIYCGHEYTERILSEVEGIARKLVQAGGAASASLQTYLRDVSLENKRVRALRVASDGLEDVANDAREHKSPAGSSYRLPVSSMPTTLAIEKHINPLLTLDEAAFKDPAVKPLWSEDTFDQGGLEQLLYCSPCRCVCGPTKESTAKAAEAPATASAGE